MKRREALFGLMTFALPACSAPVDLAAERHAKAVKALIDLGAEVNDIEDEVSLDKGTFIQLFGEHFSPGGRVDDKVYAWLRDIRSCFLGLKKTPVTDDGLSDLARLPELRVVDFTGTKITDRGLSLISKSQQIRLLMLNFTRITDNGLDVLANMSALRLLYLGDTSISDAGLKKLETLPQLEAIRFTRLPVTDDGVKSMSVMPRLRFLGLSETAVTDACLKHFDLLPNLVNLEIEGTRITAEAVAAFRKRHPKCHVVY